MIITIGGGVSTSSGTVGIGSTVAYNHIDRETSAYINGNVNATEEITVNAQNTGNLIATSLSGAVTYDGNFSSLLNAGGSNGAHVHQDTDQGIIELEMENTDPNGFVDLTEALLNVFNNENHGNDMHVLDNGNDVINNVANQGHGANDYVNRARNGFAIAANVAVNDIVDNL